MTSIDKTLKKLEDLGQKACNRKRDKDEMLPYWPDSKRGTPNSFLRSALFSVSDYKKERVELKNAVVFSLNGITVQYTGEQLDQSDLTLWETLVHIAKDSPLGTVCEFTAYEILKVMNLSLGGEQYERLDRGIARMVKCSVTITQGRGRFIGHLIESALIDDVTRIYKIDLGKKMLSLYHPEDVTWIDAEQRLQLRRKSLAQFLHGFYSTHEKPYAYKVETLHSLSGSGIKEMKRFKQSLKAALEELVEIGFLESYKIEKNLLTVSRK